MEKKRLHQSLPPVAPQWTQVHQRKEFRNSLDLVHAVYNIDRRESYKKCRLPQVFYPHAPIATILGSEQCGKTSGELRQPLGGSRISPNEPLKE